MKKRGHKDHLWGAARTLATTLPAGLERAVESVVAGLPSLRRRRREASCVSIEGTSKENNTRERREILPFPPSPQKKKRQVGWWGAGEIKPPKTTNSKKYNNQFWGRRAPSAAACRSGATRADVCTACATNPRVVQPKTPIWTHLRFFRKASSRLSLRIWIMPSSRLRRASSASMDFLKLFLRASVREEGRSILTVGVCDAQRRGDVTGVSFVLVVKKRLAIPLRASPCVVFCAEGGEGESLGRHVAKWRKTKKKGGKAGKTEKPCTAAAAAGDVAMACMMEHGRR